MVSHVTHHLSISMKNTFKMNHETHSPIQIKCINFVTVSIMHIHNLIVTGCNQVFGVASFLPREINRTSTMKIIAKFEYFLEANNEEKSDVSVLKLSIDNAYLHHRFVIRSNYQNSNTLIK